VNNLEDRRLAFLVALKRRNRNQKLTQLARSSGFLGSEAGSLLAAYKDWQPPSDASSAGLDIFAPTLLKSIPDDSYYHLDFRKGKAQLWNKDLLHLCLYVDRIWVPDPLEILSDIVVSGARNH